MVSGPVPNFPLSGSNIYKKKKKKNLYNTCWGQCNICRHVNVNDYWKLLLFPCPVTFHCPQWLFVWGKEKSNDPVLQQSGLQLGLENDTFQVGSCTYIDLHQKHAHTDTYTGSFVQLEGILDVNSTLSSRFRRIMCHVWTMTSSDQVEITQWSAYDFLGTFIVKPVGAVKLQVSSN